MATLTPVPARFSLGGHTRVAALGAGAVLIVAAGLSASLVLPRPAAEHQPAASAVNAVAAAAAVRDQWYLDLPSAQAPGVVAPQHDVVRDRWYADH